MHQFLVNNREELIRRCRHKVSERSSRGATTAQLEHGIPLFLAQLTRTLGAEEANLPFDSFLISGAAGGDAEALSEIGVTAAVHGSELLQLGFSVDQVVHDYGDLCQAITDLAFERDAPFLTEEFRTLNRCLDNAIAGAVTEFSRLREAQLLSDQAIAANQRMGFLVHEVRNALGTAMLAVRALEMGNMTIRGATGTILKRSLQSLATLVDSSVEQVRQAAAAEHRIFRIAEFIDDAGSTARLDPLAHRCKFTVAKVDAALACQGNRGLLLSALLNVVQNAFKFTCAHTEVSLTVSTSDGYIRIEVADHCGGLPKGSATEMFTPFLQRSGDKSGLGLGLSIARRSIEADAGTLTVRDVPGSGCVFTISLPHHDLLEGASP